MSELQIIESALERAARRRRWARALRGLWGGLLVGAILSLLLTGVWHLFPVPMSMLVAAALVPLPCALAGAVVGASRMLTRPQVARWLDGRSHLQERLSTALEVAGDDTPAEWRELVLADAAAHVKSLDPRQLLPFRLPKLTRWTLLALALGAGLGFVPEYRTQQYRQKKADEANIRQVGRQLAELTRRSLDKRTPAREPARDAIEAVRTLGDELGKQSLTRGEALKDLSNVAEKLKDQLKELGKDPALKKMEQAARASNGGETANASGLQKQIEALQKQLGAPTGKPDSLEKLKKDLQKLQEAAQGMADKPSGPSEAEKQKLSEALSALSKQAQDLGMQMPQLDEAIEALANNNTDLMLKDVQASLNDLEKMRDMAKQLQQLQQQMEKLGKDLAEQLDKGQAEAAQSTLQKMINQLQAANLTPEQLQKLMEDVAKAVSPAAKYGKAGEHMKNASKRLQAGDKQAAAKELAAAAKELEKMMDQMADAKQLAAELAALNEAAQCIGTGQGWRANNRPGAKPGGRPGSGVGTWADESADWNGEFTKGWDNSGVVREELDPRGQTDRGDGEVTDGFRPTKVKGQFSPGGNMPSITLKGVSIKGQSKVAYEEAAAAAQSDAESALSQEKVPRAYQGAVKEYFDDIKK